MDIRLSLQGQINERSIRISGSKSETNRLLLLKALFPGLEIANGSSSDDSEVMLQALEGNDKIIDIHHAGTAMRFLTAYFAIQEGRDVILTGSQRMRERPIAVLVNALRSLGADIEYVENEGFPPLKITGKRLSGSKVTIQANVSSQYITALLLIAGKLENGLELTLEGDIASRPYIEMTLALLKEIGVDVHLEGNKINVSRATGNHVTSSAVEMPEPETRNLVVESDWSSASYFYSIIALSEVGASVTLSSFKKNSLQGDSALQHIYRELGVETTFEGNTITLTKTPNPQPVTLNLELNNTPDIAQTIAVTCFGLGVRCHLTGLHTLKIKETDRLSALKAELEKLGAKVNITNDSLTLEPNTLFSARVSRPGSLSFGEGRGEDLLNMNEAINTYNDHRMALAFAPLALKRDIIIKDAEVVSKSYPAFWDDLKLLGFEIRPL
jgi:3-phosphoshikimate 1-carboxyvinyltransferase